MTLIYVYKPSSIILRYSIDLKHSTLFRHGIYE